MGGELRCKAGSDMQKQRQLALIGRRKIVYLSALTHGNGFANEGRDAIPASNFAGTANNMALEMELWGA
jgi:hypothetical protein